MWYSMTILCMYNDQMIGVTFFILLFLIFEDLSVILTLKPVPGMLGSVLPLCYALSLLEYLDQCFVITAIYEYNI